MPSVTATSLTFLALAASSLALPALISPPGSQCYDFVVPVAVDANNTIWDIPRIDNDIDAVDFIWNLTERSAPAVTDRIQGYQRVQQSFNIRSQLCVPTNGTKSNVLQIATHGGNVGSAYWDSAFEPENYSYVKAALNAGYSIMWYDRLGCGLSDKPDAYDIVQFPVEIEILKELTMLAHNGTLMPSSQTQQILPKFEKIVLLGHSIGSVITAEVAGKYPSVADGVVLTGFAPTPALGITGNQEFGIIYAQNGGPAFADRPSGYLVSATASNAQLNFFKKGAFDPSMLAYAFSISDSATAAEVIGLNYEVATFNASSYLGPVLMVVGEHDYVVCDGNCDGIVDTDAIKSKYFQQATNVTAHIHPGSGHALTLHFNATGHYQSIFNYLSDNSL